MTRPRLGWICAMVLLFATSAGGQSRSPTRAAQTRPTPKPQTQRRLPKGFLSKTIKLPNGEQRKYAIFIPPQYQRDSDHQWPLLLFLHGSGECGGDGVKQTTIGLPVFVSRRPTRFPFIVVMPQAREMWFRGKEAAAVWAILDDVLAEYRVDRDRMYLTGLSMGGFGTWELSVLRPDVFAAIVPVCGAAPLEYLSNIAGLPVWAFHGAKDKNVSVSGSRDAVQRLRQLGASPQYTEFPTLAHECWDDAYATPGLWRWLLQKRRGPPPTTVDYCFPGGISRAWWLVAEAAENARKPVHIHAKIGEGGQVVVTSEGVVGWALVSDGPPLTPGQTIDVTWNGSHVFEGKFTGRLTLSPDEPTSGPAPQKKGRARRGKKQPTR